MAFTLEEKVKIRHHLGYLGVAAAQTFALGAPAAVETQFIVEGAMNRVMPEAEPEVRRQLEILNSIEDQMNADRELLVVDRVDEIQIRPREMDELRREYLYWRNAMANLLGIYPNPWDRRFSNAGINVPVSG
jgi:hypothetical protein